MDKDVRSIDGEVAEIRTVGNSRVVEGYGIVFNQESRDLGGFTEVILPEAVDGVLERSDILCLLNHNLDRGVLARCTNGSGSMTLTKDSKGVKYRFIAPNSSLGDELVEGIKRGDIRTSSFSFTVEPKDTTFERRADGSRLRTIRKFSGLYDMSPVYREAYSTTTVTLRSLEEFDQSEQEREAKEQEANAAPAETVVDQLEERTEADQTVDYADYEERLNKLRLQTND